MLSQWPIRVKVLIGIGLLLVIVATLSVSGFRGVYAYRSAVRGFRGRAEELPLAKSLSGQISSLRVIVAEARGAHTMLAAGPAPAAALPNAGAALDHVQLEGRFAKLNEAVAQTLAQYRHQLQRNQAEDSLINDNHAEWETVHRIDAALERIAESSGSPGWIQNTARLEATHAELERLEALVMELPSYLHRRLYDFAGEVRVQYRALIILTWITMILGMLLLGLFLQLFYAWVFQPLGVLIEGSRRVAAGEFGYRIALDTHDEMSELADAMNQMTARFEAIRDDLDRQVRERTKQVVRSEQLASVGFLAAGVAHEINNPLASIALCAESLESRLHDSLDALPEMSRDDGEVVRNYLRMIQNEAFRCKGITERLLDFSRTGDVARQATDLAELVRGVIAVVGHLGRYQEKQIELVAAEPAIAPVNAQEMKQVVLNLITNALDSMSAGGRLVIELRQRDGEAEMLFTDDGCGMTDEVLKHLFEPFFTRRRNGQGTGLGLSITYRIISDHGGHIDVHSDGPGKGSQFRVSLPLTEKQKEPEHRYQAA
ncbi:MAG: sensor histidine kinase [Pirellulales bacterium]